VLDDQQLLRFNRQLLLPQIDIDGQEKLLASHVTIVGLGGLGCPAATYLAASGVGRITLIDHDLIEITNLQRQLAYSDENIGESKVSVMTKLIAKLNPNCKVEQIDQRFNPTEQHSSIESSNVLIDATDNLEARRSINQYAVAQKIPLVFAAAIRMEGQLAVFDSRINNSPCYECVFGHTDVNESCSESGVLGTVVGTIGLMQATETIKLLLNIGESLIGRLQLYDAFAGEWQTIKLSKRADCSVCN